MRAKSRIFVFIFFLTASISGFSQAWWHIWRAVHQTERGNLQKARQSYQKAIRIKPNSRKANMGVGLLLSESMEMYADAIPYLENAMRLTRGDTIADLFYAAAKSYQFVEEYKTSLFYLDKLKNVNAWEDDNKEFHKDVLKRTRDCRYALLHAAEPKDSTLHIVNAGSRVNTSAPEYVPVITKTDQLIFTSKRKDHRLEELNHLDAKYYESMYIVAYEKRQFGEVRRYTVPDEYLNSKYTKGNESAISISSDGRRLFIFRNGKLMEVNMDEAREKKPMQLPGEINFGRFQSHAYLTADNNSLYFTSDARGGLGDNDIYVSFRNKDGSWSEPKNLGAPVNTEYDDDAPYVSDDGKTLYFASKGHDGFGNYDLFKSTMNANGNWETPVNLGKPFNSSGHDIFLTLKPDGSYGYFSSSRPGGFGDMDIYRVSDLNKIKHQCSDSVSIMTSGIEKNAALNIKQTFSFKLPAKYKLMHTEWRLNDTVLNDKGASITLTLKKGECISLKAVLIGDTCLEPLVVCGQYKNAESSPTPDKVINHSSVPDLKTISGQLNVTQLQALGFLTEPILFSSNTVKEESAFISALETNARILINHPSLYIELIGHADEKGEPIYNQKLSLERAQQIKQLLLNMGVKKQQITSVVGVGEKEPTVICESKEKCPEDVLKKNRRVEFKVFNRANGSE